MFAVYEYLTGATAANIIADIIKMLIGDHIISNYSASCNKNSTIIRDNTIPPGWTVHDDTASASSKVLKSAYANNPAKFKYVELSAPTTSALYLYACEDWNATNHAPVNRAPVASLASFPQRWQSAGEGRFYIFATPAFICILSEYGTTIGDAQGGCTLLAEYSRIQPWHTAESPYPAVCSISIGQTIGYTSKMAYVPRAKQRSGLDATVVALNIATVGASTANLATASQFPTGADAKILDAAGNRVCPLFPLYLVDPPVFSAPIGDLSGVSDVWLAPHAVLSNLEEIPRGADKYIAVQAGNNGQRIVVRLS